MSFQDLVNLMDALRGEKGCPWDKKQTLDSLKPFLIEEAYEVIEAIEQGDPAKLKEELGDLLFHILFLSKVSADTGTFDIEDVIQFEHEKMTRRHPHVFGPQEGQPLSEAPHLTRPRRQSGEVPKQDSRSRDAAETQGGVSKRGEDESTTPILPKTGEEVLRQWYAIKRQERADKGIPSLMDSIPRKLPALQKAQKVQRRAAQVGFDWEEPEEVLEKVSEEIQELRAAISGRRQDDVSEEMGDLLFSVVNVCRFLEVEAESALRGTIAKFVRRFRAMERRAAAAGKRLSDSSLEELDAEWEAVKAKENPTRKGEGGN